MQWLDVAGPPGSGKSALCDPLWGPHSIAFEGITVFNPEWGPYLEVCNALVNEIHDHKHPVTGQPTVEAVRRMLYRSIRKIAAVEAIMAEPHQIYVQTGLVQRGLGFGWRLFDLGKIKLVRRYFEVMPVSYGVVMTKCPRDVIAARNLARLDNPETAHENRSFMIHRMEPAIEIAQEVFRERGVNYAEIRTDQPLEEARRQLIDLLPKDPAQRAPDGSRREVEAVPLSRL